MGGKAFSHGPNPLYTPRMPTAVYELVRDHCHAVLRQLFIVVASPIEGPGKEDYGDIDIFVAWQKRELYPSEESLAVVAQAGNHLDPLKAAASLLGVERTLPTGESGSAMFALPWPTQLLKDLATDTTAEDVDNPRHIQIDVHVCPSLETVAWFLFKHSHGDLWSLLGSTIRPFGLTVDEQGLWLRIPEIEHLDKKKAKVLLTRDPSEILTFIGLDPFSREWETKFENIDDLFQYVTSCRLFWAKPAGDDQGKAKEVIDESGGNNPLTATEKKKVQHRPLFRKWVEEFLPKCRQEGRGTQNLMTRDKVREEAFERFIGTRHEYSQRLLGFRIKMQHDRLLRDVIKPAFPASASPPFPAEEAVATMWKSCTSSAFKKVILDGDQSFGILLQTSLKDSQGMFDENEVRKFVRDNFDDMAEVAWAKNQNKFHEHKRLKASEEVAKDGAQASQHTDMAMEKLTSTDRANGLLAASVENQDEMGTDGKEDGPSLPAAEVECLSAACADPEA